jgi:HEAT repeat protein
MDTEQIPFSTILESIFDDEVVSVASLYRLSDMAEEDETRFWRRWSQADADRRRIIARHLADLVEEDFVLDYEPLFKRFLQDEHTPVRVAALDGLWDAEDTTLVDPILHLLMTDADVAVQTAAAAALAHYVLFSEWKQLPSYVSPQIVAVLLEKYEKKGTAVSVKRAALEGMGAANHPRVDELIRDAYDDPDLDMQLSAIFAMGNSADAKWLPTVMEEMGSSYSEMRAEAALAAGSIGSSDAVAQLKELAEEDDPDVALVAVTALGQIASDEAREILTNLAEDPDYEELHEAIAEALEEIAILSGELNFMDLYRDDDEDEEDY